MDSRDRANLEADWAKISADLKRAIDHVLIPLTTALRQAHPEPCDLCGDNLAGLNQADRQTHWRSHSPWQRGWHWAKGLRR